MTNTNWKQHVSLKDIPTEKLDFLQKIAFDATSLKEKERLPFLLSLTAKAKQSHISFSQDEISSIIAVLKEVGTPEEVAKMNQMLTILKSHQK